MGSSFRILFIFMVFYLVFGKACGYDRRVSRSLLSTTDYKQLASIYGRVRRQAPPFPSSSGDTNDQFIPRIDPPPPGSILTYDGKSLSTSIGAFSIVPKSERRTPPINLNRPQYATFRGELPPAIPDVIPRDLPQFQNRRSIVADFPPGFRNN